MKIGRIKTRYVLLFGISLFGLIIRFAFKDVLSNDMQGFLLPWYRKISGLDIRTALATQVGNYNLMYQNVILLMTRLPGDPLHQYKLVSVLFDFIMAFGVYAFLREVCDTKKAICGFAFAVLMPSVWLNSAAWGQCDSIYTAMIVWSLYFLYKGRRFVPFVFLGLALSFKLQTVFILPFYVYLYLKGLADKNKKVSIYGFVIMILVPVVMALPNILAGRPLSDLINVYIGQMHTYREMYLNYPSVWSVLRLSYDTDRFWCMGLTIVILCALMLLFYLKKADVWGKHFLWCAFVLSYTCVLFLPAMHERYGFLYEILSFMLAIFIGRGWSVVAAIQLLTLKTYMYYLYQVPLDIEFLGIVNILIYAVVLYAFFRELNGNPPGKELFKRNEGPRGELPFCRNLVISRSDKRAIGILVLTFVLLGSMRLGNTKAPETSVRLGTGTENGTEAYISFNKTEEVGSVCIYQKMSRKVVFKLYYAKDGSWIPVTEDGTTGGVFFWTKVDADVSTHELCLIIKDPSAELAEIVCLDKNGKRIDVKGASFKELTDEQDCLSGTPTGYDSTIFDEVYHARTAYEFINELPIYENTHPPLGKSLISIGITLFGMNPFGYRIMSLLFGAMLIPVIYLFALRITGKSEFALLAGILQVTEFMHFTLSRIATIDIFVAFFVMCMLYGTYAFLQEGRLKYLVFSGAAFAFGAATKWTALYAAPAVGILLLSWIIRNRKTDGTKKMLRFIAICIGCFVLLPCMVYAISYIPFVNVYPDKGIFGHAVSNSVSMFNYHSSVEGEHPYASSWYEWLFDIVPLIDVRTYLGAYKSTIATFVNPFTCFVGLASVFHHIYLSFKKDRTSVILLLFYLCMLVPWMLIKRTVFIYQYFICTKIMILMIINSIQKLSFEDEPGVIKTAAGLSAGLFAAYFPVISGVAASTAFIDKILRILPKWWF